VFAFEVVYSIFKFQVPVKNLIPRLKVQLLWRSVSFERAASSLFCENGNITMIDCFRNLLGALVALVCLSVLPSVRRLILANHQEVKVTKSSNLVCKSPRTTVTMVRDFILCRSVFPCDMRNSRYYFNVEGGSKSPSITKLKHTMHYNCWTNGIMIFKPGENVIPQNCDRICSFKRPKVEPISSIYLINWK